MLFLDSAILDTTEWVCRRFQVLTGKTNVWVAVQLTNLSIVVYFVWAAMSFWNTDGVTRTIVGLFCGGLLYALSQTVLKEPIEAYEKSAYLRVAKGLRNPRRIRDVLMRTSFLTLSLILFAPVWYAYAHLRVPVVLLTYSLITDDRPPVRTRLRSSSAMHRQGPDVGRRTRAVAGGPAHDPAPHRTSDARERARQK